MTPTDKLNPIKCGGVDYLVPGDADGEMILALMLYTAMNEETASLKHTMTSKRWALSHKFILECFDRLKLYHEALQRPKEN